MHELTPAAEKFILHWGEMGSRWGINRTVAQVHALLYISDHPLHAEEITDTLGVARSNVSTSLRELQNWGIVKIVHVMGDRRDHFTSVEDVWELFETIFDERKRREIDPTLHVLEECVRESSDNSSEKGKLLEMLDFVQTMDTWYENVRRLPVPMMRKFFKMADRVKRFANEKTTSKTS